MCVAIYKPKGAKFPTRETLKNCWTNNPDGAGLAIHVPPVKKGQEGTVKIIKGLMSFKSMYKTIRSLQLDEHEAVLHFRWATSGTVDDGMTHPFPVSNDRHDLRSLELETDKAVIHNGVMFTPKFTENWSDTAIFARWLHVAKPSNNRLRKVLGGDRLAIVCKDKGVKLLGSWHKIKDCYFSNLYSHTIYKSQYSGTAWKSGMKWDWLTKSYVDADDNWGNTCATSTGGHYNRSNHYDNSFAYHDSRHEIPDEKELDVPSDDMGICPVCSSDNVYLVGMKTNTCECQDCGVVYNEADYLIPKNWDLIPVDEDAEYEEAD